MRIQKIPVIPNARDDYMDVGGRATQDDSTDGIGTPTGMSVVEPRRELVVESRVWSEDRAVAEESSISRND
jgi:hypothetical protein